MEPSDHAKKSGIDSGLDTGGRWDEVVRESHERSRRYGVARALVSSPESSRLSPRELEARSKKNAPLLRLAVAQVNLLRQILEDSSFCSAIADTEGYVLHVFGEGPIMDQFHRRRCLPGYRWQERDVGTCAIGLVLHTGKPVLLHGHQMYSTSAQHVTNSATPVFDPRGSLICVISLSGFADRVHLHTLGMLMQAAENVRLQIEAQEKASDLDLYAQYMNSLVESDHRGIVTLDRQGNIVRFNNKAKELIGLTERSKGKDIDSMVASPLSVKTYVRSGKSFTDREVVFMRAGVELKHVASLDPFMQNGEVVGGLLSVMEQDRAMRLVNAMAGDQAAFTFDSIIGGSPAIRKAVQTSLSAAMSRAPVLLQGETGTGKELFAQAIHNASPRARSPFVVINCGAIPKELLESELFGYEEGAFTGAQKGGRPGKLELAHGGTLFLDEIGDMPFDMQVKLLRTLQSGEIQRLGSSRGIRLDLRIVTATNADLRWAIGNRRFREDLYYRISTIVLDVPPLRERGEDVLLLAEVFLARYCGALGRSNCAFSEEARRALVAYSWPGNVRQLENRVERAVVLSSDSFIDASHLGLSREEERLEPVTARSGPAKRISLEQLEKQYIMELLDSRENLSELARVLGISRPTLYRKLNQYGLRRPEQDRDV